MRAYSNSEFLKLYRKLLDWEWYTDINTKVLFLHCLLRANWKAGSWQGIPYEAGSFITSVPSLAKETGLSEKAVRVALGKLIKTGELGSQTRDERAGKRLAKCRVITVKNWYQYQTKGRQKAGNGAGKGQQYKNNKEYTEDKKRARVQIEQHDYNFDEIDRQLAILQTKEAEDYEQRNMG